MCVEGLKAKKEVVVLVNLGVPKLGLEPLLQGEVKYDWPGLES